MAKKRKANNEDVDDEPQEKKSIIIVEPHVKINEGPYRFTELKKYEKYNIYYPLFLHIGNNICVEILLPGV